MSRSKIIYTLHIYTQLTDCSIWTIKVVGDKSRSHWPILP